MIPEWKDVTSYSRGEERIPRWWSIQVGQFTITVGNFHINYRENPHWLMTVPWADSHIELGKLAEFTEKTAKREALNRVTRLIGDTWNQLQEILRGTHECNSKIS